jgi:hypothetical protein
MMTDLELMQDAFRDRPCDVATVSAYADALEEAGLGHKASGMRALAKTLKDDFGCATESQFSRGLARLTTFAREFLVPPLTMYSQTLPAVFVRDFERLTDTEFYRDRRGRRRRRHAKTLYRYVALQYMVVGDEVTGVCDRRTVSGTRAQAGFRHYSDGDRCDIYPGRVLCCVRLRTSQGTRSVVQLSRVYMHPADFVFLSEVTQ